MPLARQHVVAAALVAGAALLTSVSYLEWGGSFGPGSDASSASPEPGGLASPAPPAGIAKADSACAFEPWKEKAKALRERASDLAKAAQSLAERVGLHDANFEDAAAEVTLQPDSTTIARLQTQIAHYEAAFAQWLAFAEKQIDSSFDDFMKEVEIRAPAILSTTIPVEYESAKKDDEKFRADGVPSTDPRRQAAQEKVQLYRDQLIRYCSGLNGTQNKEDRFVLEHLQNPASTIAEYQAAKDQYLATKAEAADAQQHYEAARQVPLPASRTKDWRLSGTQPAARSER